MPITAPTVVVTGANGFVGRRVSELLAQRGADVRALVRRAGTAPTGPGLTELVGDFTDPGSVGEIVAGADAVVTTVHPMGSDRATQHAVGVQGTRTIAEAAAAAGVGRLLHVSTAGVYDRSPGVGDIDESGALVPDDAGDYGVTKRDADQALAQIDGITRVLLRPPAILGPGPSSTWNTLTPASMRDDEAARHVNPDLTFAWVHVDDLATLIADLATGLVADASDPADGPVGGGCTAVNVCAGNSTHREYRTTVADALGLELVWEQGPVWTGRILADRARGWGWTPAVTLETALAEVSAGLREPPAPA
jgi:2-alkyl-3-oxoalkanoate reductase